MPLRLPPIFLSLTCGLGLGWALQKFRLHQASAVPLKTSTAKTQPKKAEELPAWNPPSKLGPARQVNPPSDEDWAAIYAWYLAIPEGSRREELHKWFSLLTPAKQSKLAKSIPRMGTSEPYNNNTEVTSVHFELSYRALLADCVGAWAKCQPDSALAWVMLLPSTSYQIGDAWPLLVWEALVKKAPVKAMRTLSAIPEDWKFDALIGQMASSMVTNPWPTWDWMLTLPKERQEKCLSILNSIPDESAEELYKRCLALPKEHPFREGLCYAASRIKITDPAAIWNQLKESTKNEYSRRSLLLKLLPDYPDFVKAHLSEVGYSYYEREIRGELELKQFKDHRNEVFSELQSLTDPAQRSRRVQRLLEGMDVITAEDVPLLNMLESVKTSVISSDYWRLGRSIEGKPEDRQAILAALSDQDLLVLTTAYNFAYTLRAYPEAYQEMMARLPEAERNRILVAASNDSSEGEKEKLQAVYAHVSLDESDRYNELTRLAVESPQQAAVKILATKEHWSSDLLTSTIDEWMSRDSASCLAWANNLSGQSQWQVRDTLLARSSQNEDWKSVKDIAREAAATYEAGLSNPNPDERPSIDAANAALGQLAGDNVSDAVQFVQSLPAGEARSSLTTSILSSWLEADPEAASRAALEIPSQSTRDQAIKTILSGIEQEDPESAVAWALHLSEPEAQKQAIWSLAPYLAETEGGLERALQNPALTAPLRGVLQTFWEDQTPAR